jgi:hypothetical protein
LSDATLDRIDLSVNLIVALDLTVAAVQTPTMAHVAQLHASLHPTNAAAHLAATGCEPTATSHGHERGGDRDGEGDTDKQGQERRMGMRLDLDGRNERAGSCERLSAFSLGSGVFFGAGGGGWRMRGDSGITDGWGLVDRVVR